MSLRLVQIHNYIVQTMKLHEKYKFKMKGCRSKVEEDYQPGQSTKHHLVWGLYSADRHNQGKKILAHLVAVHDSAVAGYNSAEPGYNSALAGYNSVVSHGLND